jgi:hypothetical protein
MGSHLGQQAVVIDGSLAGLMVARAHADHFDTIPVLEQPTSTMGPHCINPSRRAPISTPSCSAVSR